MIFDFGTALHNSLLLLHSLFAACIDLLGVELARLPTLLCSISEMKLTAALTFLHLLLAAAFGAEAETVAAGGRGGLRRTSSNDSSLTSDRYWIVPVKDVGLTCIGNSIRAGGDKDDEYKCITDGEALCIEYEQKPPMGGKWTFGLKDSRAKLWNPKMEVVWEFCTDVTHICIGEEHGYDPKRFSEQRPYLKFYNEKTQETVGNLACDGTDGKVRTGIYIPSFIVGVV